MLQIYIVLIGILFIADWRKALVINNARGKWTQLVTRAIEEDFQGPTKMFACWLKSQGYCNMNIRKAFEETFHVRLTSSTVATLTNPRNMQIMEHELMVTMTLSDWFQAIGIQSEDD